MSSQYIYGLYLDSKMIGAARQLVKFFEQEVFDKKNTIIYLKKYKESAKLFSKIFSKEGIEFKFMKPRELDALEDQVIFYAFNAQSNCRLVANRKLKHIFITHGESNKVSSIKPIIRIYDHVVASGKLSLERYYKSGLFDEHDYETGRLIMMGDTFIGCTGFSSDDRKENVLFYAPTWEGGLESENYSSLQNRDLVYNVILQIAKQQGLNSIVIQPHPNLGYRDKYYLKMLIGLIKLLYSCGFKIYFQRNDISLPWLEKYRLTQNNIGFIERLDSFFAKHALTDISAMEFQCINERINHQVFYIPQMLRPDIPEALYQKYQESGINLEHNDYPLSMGAEVFPYLDNVISFSINQLQYMTKCQRVKVLAQKN